MSTVSVVLALLTIVSIIICVMMMIVMLRQDRYVVRVGRSHDGDRPIQFMVSAILYDRKEKEALVYERVDMREDDWETQLGEAIARMKQRKSFLKAISRMASE